MAAAMITQGTLMLAAGAIGLVSTLIWLTAGLATRRKKEAALVKKAVSGSFSTKSGAVSAFESSPLDMATESMVGGDTESTALSFEKSAYLGGDGGTESVSYSDKTESMAGEKQANRSIDSGRKTDSLTSSFTERVTPDFGAQDKTEGFSPEHTEGLVSASDDHDLTEGLEK